MANTIRQAAARQFETHIRRSNEVHAEYLNDARQYRNYDRFTQWQLDYLLTYFDELRSQDAYADALNFVVSELAGVSVSERDRQLARAAPAVTGLMPLGALQTLAKAATLNARTLEINLNICRQLETGGELPGEITEHGYFVACRKASNYEECMEFLHVALALGRALGPTVRHRVIGLTLKAMNVPAHATGFGDLQMFFEKGYDTFRGIPDLDYFLAHTEERMTTVFRRIYAVTDDQ
jgi:hypothetical protein